MPYVIAGDTVIGSCPHTTTSVVTSNGHCSGSVKSKRLSPARNDLLLLSMSLLVLPFIPATNLFFYVGFVVAERVLYIPSAGYCLLVSLAVSRCRRHHCVRGFRGRTSVYVMMTLLVTSLAARTYVRNADWLNEEALYRSGIGINPAKGLSASFVFVIAFGF